jgi:hypothetical protein
VLDSLVGHPPSSVVVDFCLKAWEKFHLEMPESTSIGNFLLEAREIKDLFPKFQLHFLDAKKKTAFLQKTAKIKRGKVKFGHKINSRVKLTRKKPINIKTVNNAFLGQQYGWLPLISDIGKLANVVDSVTNRLKFLMEMRDKPVKLHFHRENVWQHPMLDTEQTIPRFQFDSPDYGYGYTLNQYASAMTASCTLVQDLQGLDDAWASWRGLLASLGLNNPAKILWNAIPFTFVVDMFVPISSWLNAAHLRPFAGKWEVTEVTTSMLEKGEFKVRGSCMQSKNNSGSAGTISFTRYRRQLGLPLLQTEVSLSELSTLQQTLLTSLVLGNLRSL